jgi:hypothetical protein
MLISIDTGRPINYIPHKKEYEIWKSRLTQEQFEVIRAELDRRIEGGEVHTSSWIPGENWTGTVFEPIYEVACRRNVEAAALCFGLILWEVMMRRPENWSFGRYEKNGIPIKGLTYFQVR